MKYFSAIAILLLTAGCFCSLYTEEYPSGRVTKTVYFGISTSDGIELYTTEAPEMQTDKNHPVPSEEKIHQMR